MVKIIRGIKKLFGICDLRYEYLVQLSDIKVPQYYKQSWIKPPKWQGSWNIG